MYGDQISWTDYTGFSDGGSAYGYSSQADVDELNKALNAGHDRDPPASAVAGDGFALRVESLENTLKVVTYSMKEIVFWRRIPKRPAFNTVEEHNVLHSYGDNLDSGFIAEGDLPEEESSTYERKHAFVKFIGRTRKVSHVMSLLKPAHGDNIAQETQNGTMDILRIMEQALFYADSNLISVQFDGFFKLLTDAGSDTTIIDLRGQPLTEDVLTDVTTTVRSAPNYGTITDMYMNPVAKNDLDKSFYPKGRYDQFNRGADGRVGLNISGFTCDAGDVAFHADSFINDGGGPLGAQGDATKRPASPTITTAATSPVDATAQFTADDAGDYLYVVQAVNRYGRSANVSVGAAVTVSAGDKVTFGVTHGAGAGATEYYHIFRTKKNGAATTERSILKVKNAAGAGEQIVNDLNAYLPGTTTAFLFQEDMQSIGFKQLAPMVKIPLAIVDTNLRWMQLVYGVPVLYAPRKNAMIINIGRPSGSVG